MTHRTKAVLFDKDGTLLDFTATYGPAIPEVIADLLGERDGGRFEAMADILGYDLASGRFRDDSFLIAGSTADYLGDFARATGLAADKALADRIDALFRRFALPSVTLFDGVVAVLDELAARGLPVGVATNDAELNTHAQLEAAGLGGRFPFVVGYDSGHGGKPAPGQILAFARHAGVEPSEVAMIGDSVHDLAAARAAGAVAVGVTTGFYDAAHLGPHADLLLAELSELLDAVDLPPRGSSRPVRVA